MKTIISKLFSSKLRAFLTLLVIAVFILMAFLFVARPVFVFDYDTGKPIQGAEITAGGIEGWWEPRCINETKHTTDGRGLALLLGREDFGLCFLEIAKEGYHPTGENNPGEINDFPWIGRVSIKKIKNPRPFIDGEVTFYEAEGADFKLAIENKSPDFLIPTAADDNARNLDFFFPSITNVGDNMPGGCGIGEGIATIEFNGDGGVLEIPSNDYPYWLGDKTFALENITQAPESGYQKRMELKAGGQYLARLRDGNQYIKFIAFMSKDLDCNNYVELGVIAILGEGRNIETINSVRKVGQFTWPAD